MCGLSGESGENFGEFTPLLGIVDRGPIICGQWKTLEIWLSVCCSSTPSCGVDDWHFSRQPVSLWMTNNLSRRPPLMFVVCLSPF